MPSSRDSNPRCTGDNYSQSAAISADYLNPVNIGLVRIPLSGQTIVQYKLPSYAIILSMQLDLTTVYSSGAVNVGTTSNGTELAAFATLTATGRLAPTLTAAQITASKASTLGAGGVTIYASPSSTAGAGVGELVMLVGFANFKSPA